MSCTYSDTVCIACIEDIPECIPEAQVARWMYLYREKLIQEKKDEDSVHSRSTRRSD